jgi:hypothetical protein
VHFRPLQNLRKFLSFAQKRAGLRLFIEGRIGLFEWTVKGGLDARSFDAAK